jgi:hypothetical protein
MADFRGILSDFTWYRFEFALALYRGVNPEEVLVNSGKTLFAQLMDFVPWSSFHRIVGRYGGNERFHAPNIIERWRLLN